MNDKVNEETYDEMKFPLDIDSEGKINDEIRRSQFIPYQRARTIGPEEMRQIQHELLDKF